MAALLGAALGCSKERGQGAGRSGGALPVRPPDAAGPPVRITSIGATSYTVSREALELGLVEALVGDVKVTAVSGGYRISALRTGSVAARAGLMMDDLVTRVAGVDLVRPDSLLGAFAKVRGGFGFDVELTRGRESLKLSYRVADRDLPPYSPPAPLPPIDGITRKVDTPERAEFEIKRTLLDQWLSNTAQLAAGARIVPSIKDGQPNGFKLYAIRPSSVYAALGLMNGDTVSRINGQDLSSPDSALEVYGKLKGSKEITVDIMRRGQPVTNIYRIVD